MRVHNTCELTIGVFIPALPGDVAGAARAQERLGGGADALRGRQPVRGGRHAAAPHGRLHAAAAHRPAHAPRARAARPGASQDEGKPRTPSYYKGKIETRSFYNHCTYRKAVNM